MCSSNLGQSQSRKATARVEGTSKTFETMERNSNGNSKAKLEENKRNDLFCRFNESILRFASDDQRFQRRYCLEQSITQFWHQLLLFIFFFVKQHLKKWIMSNVSWNSYLTCFPNFPPVVSFMPCFKIFTLCWSVKCQSYFLCQREGNFNLTTMLVLYWLLFFSPYNLKALSAINWYDFILW